MVRVIRMVAAAAAVPSNQAGNDEHRQIPQRVFGEGNQPPSGGAQPHQMAG